MPYDPEADSHLVALLRDYATKPEELTAAFMKAGIDVQTAFELVAACVGADAGKRFFGRFLRQQSPEVEAATAKAADVKRVIDAIRQQEGNLRTATLAERLNDLGIPAPRGGAWRGEQVYRVLKRSGEGQRPRRKNRPPPGAPPLEKQADKRRPAKRKSQSRPQSG